MSRAPSPFEPTLRPPSEGELELAALPDRLGFTEEHQLLRTGARRLLAERAPIARIRALAEDREGFDRALYREMAGLGWLDFGLPGQSALGPLHAALLLEEMGRALLPSPYFAALLALWLIDATADAEQRAKLRARIVDGSSIATVALSEPDESWSPARVSTRARAAEAGYVLEGRKTHVLFAESASLVLVPCREPTGTVSLFALELPLDGVTIEPEISVDTSRRMARLTLEGARVPRSARLACDGLEALRSLEVAGAALLSAEMVGAADAVLELTRRYACERFQFGRAIGSFQAVKHPLVDLMLGVELARSLALGASALLEGGVGQATIPARMAKAHASDVLAFAVKKGVQLHGGFGFTWDCDVQLYFKRMLWSRGTLGDAVHHRRLLAQRLLGGSS